MQFGKFTQLVSTFIGVFAIAFFKGRLLTLVMLSSMPPLIIAGGMMSLVIARMSSRGQEAYAKAAIVVLVQSEPYVPSVKTRNIMAATFLLKNTI